MSEITSAVIPPMIQDLIEHICLKYPQTFAPIPSPSILTPVNASKLSRLPVVQQCEVIALACDFAASTLYSHRQHLLSTVQGSHNRQQPIYRLPNEVFSIIFEFANAPLKVSHVSKLWRQIALNTPTLWTSIHYLNLSLIELFLDRAKSAPAEVRFHTDRTALYSPLRIRNDYCPKTDAVMTRFASTLQSHAHHLRSLDLECCGISPRFFGHHLNMAMPALSSLSLNSEDAHSRYDIALREMPFGVFEGQTPCLRKLTLKRLCIPLASSIYNGLTSICLTLVSFINSSPHDFTRRLAGCPSLKSLSLNVVEFDEVDENPVLQPVHFPHLKTMELEDLEGDVVRDIFASVKVPVTLRLSLRVVDEADSTWYDMLPQGTDVMGNLPSLCAATQLNVRCELDSLSEVRGSSKSSGFFELQFCGDEGAFSRQWLFSLAQIPFPMLQDLTICNRGEDFFDSDLISHILGHLPTLISLYLYRCTAAAQTLILSPTSRLCPLLQSLALDECGASGVTAIAIARSRSNLDGNADHQGTKISCLRRLFVRNGVGFDADVIRTLQELPIELETCEDPEPDANPTA
ncbi:hypothetical protein BOTBODRAFT_193124 [Botryobasidium botryosum FD-172 SS1]|uniref:F-box domain-containing protein n=1 Tax=Botryobasidium botryosum (strain FD-172 SS1) TaxID=930990 RepID=A0A067M351_BOTB1|nr:hypothetical protein BOTBODRAFT_193124 [Botryobasidium botryosum FD-172 SS1]